MKKLTTAVLVAGIVAAVIAGCGGGGGSSGGGGVTPPTGETILTGKVMDNYTDANSNPAPRPVAGVLVKLGSLTRTTASDGTFSFDLGPNVIVWSVFSDVTQAVIKVSTHLLPSDQYPEVNVFYQGTGYEQALDGSGASIPLSPTVCNTQGATVNIGTITVQYNDPTKPPPIPL